MTKSYMVEVRKEYKNWIAKKSIIESIPIYKIFEETLFPYFKDNFTGETIDSVSFSKNDITKSLSLSSPFGKTLRLEALDQNVTVISLTDFIFNFFLTNTSESNSL